MILEEQCEQTKMPAAMERLVWRRIVETVGLDERHLEINHDRKRKTHADSPLCRKGARGRDRLLHCARSSLSGDAALLFSVPYESGKQPPLPPGVRSMFAALQKATIRANIARPVHRRGRQAGPRDI